MAADQGGLPKSPLFVEGPDARPAPRPAPTPPANDAEALRRSLAAEQARLDALARARTAAEAQLAQLQEQMAQREQAAQREILARREAALASLPSVTAPLPSPSPRPPRAEPRTEPASGAASGVAPRGAVSNAGQQRVVVHHRAGSYAAAEAAGAMAAQVREAGFDLSDTRAATATPSQRVVRYFHAEDAPAAARLAGRLGRGWALQDFRSYEPLPPPGLLEVWLPDR
ncbi:MAG: OmpH family outer membrane protein [Acetobacteraceae bacterium]|nr:OmpH family outer membrane protein [Acetobacteraceae bacterium]